MEVPLLLISPCGCKEGTNPCLRTQELAARLGGKKVRSVCVGQETAHGQQVQHRMP